MRTTLTPIALSLAAVASLVCAGCSDAEFAPPAPAAEVRQAHGSVTAAEVRPSALIGVSNCSSSGCHGHTTPPGKPLEDAQPAADAELPSGESWQTAFGVWYRDDPHRRAFEVLYAERSVKIFRLLSSHVARRSATNEPIGADAYQRFLEQRCLGCHATAVNAPHHADATNYANGVSCESCHGAARDWTVAHLLKGWRQADGSLSALARQTHFVDTKSLADRAERCVQCHVGPQQTTAADGAVVSYDVNHELIAAGHPQLEFEFDAYLANLPAHWRRQRDEQSPAGAFHFTAWLTGQEQTALQQARLAGWRATAAPQNQHGPADDDVVTPAWPELANFECSDCHHGISGQGRAGRSVAGLTRVAGAQPRYIGRAQLQLLTATFNDAGLQLQQQSFLAAVQRWTVTPPPDVLARTEALVRGLCKQIQSSPAQHLTAEQRRQVLKRQIAGDTWREAAQTFLAFRAYQADLPDGLERAALAKTLAELRRTLDDQFHDPLQPAAAQQPPGQYDTPGYFDPSQVRDCLRQLKQSLSSSPAVATP